MKKVWTLLVLLCLVVGLCFALASCGETEHTEHTWDKGTVTKAATCTEKGSMTYKCTECDETKTEEIKALGHDFKTEFAGDDENHWHECSRCGVRNGEAAHKYTADPTSPDYKPATCSVNGQAVMVCECGKTEYAPIPATGEHVKSDTLAWDDEEHYYPCTGCGLHMGAEEHTWVKGNETGLSAESCADGERVDTCECGAERHVPIASPKAHTWTYVLNAEEHTLTATCSACHKTLEHTTLFVEDYSEKNVGDRAASSASPGSVVREDEDGNLYAYLIHDAGGNTAFNVTPSNRTVTEYIGASFRVRPWFTDGTTERKCDAFEATLKVDGNWNDGFAGLTYATDGTMNIAGVQTDMVVAKDVWYRITYIYQKSTGVLTVMVDDGTRVFVGYGKSNTGYLHTSAKTIDYWHFKVGSSQAVCLDDLMIFNSDAAAAEAHVHAWNDGTVTTEPTCVPGEKTYTCNICGATKTEEVAAVNNHTPGTDYIRSDEKPDVHWHECTVCHNPCGEEAHDWREISRVEPTATSKGSATYECVCGAQKTEELEALHHIDESKWSYDDNQHWHDCTDEGCADPKVGLADHEWKVKTVNKPATCTEDGESVFVCSACGKEKTETVASVGHRFGKAVYNNEDSTVTFACSGCETKHVYTVSSMYDNDTNAMPLLDNAGKPLSDTSATNGVTTTVVTDEDGNKYLSVMGGTASVYGEGTAQYQYNYSYTVTKGAYSFDYRPVGDNIAQTNVRVIFRNTNGTGSGRFLEFLGIYGDSVRVSGKEVAKLDASKMTNFRVVFELIAPAAGATTGTVACTLYVDGIEITTATITNTLTDNKLTTLYVTGSVGAGNGCYYDNLFLMKDGD